MQADTKALVVCDGASVPRGYAGDEWTHRRDLWSHGPERNLILYGENLGCRLLSTLSDRAVDLARIAAYAYAADQELSRGGVRDVYGEGWRRHISLCVPVNDPAFWSQSRVTEALCAALHFATDDDWRFSFDRREKGARWLTLFEGPDEAVLLGNPDSVALFSGGADSLCSVIEAVTEQGRKPVLVSHRSTMPHEARQRRIVGELKNRLTGWDLPHLAFPISRSGKDSTDSSQRSRSFLFASLGAAVAAQLETRDVYLADNGIVSLNLPMSGQTVGALASRSTHPRFLSLFNDLLSLVFGDAVRVSNPLWSRTRTETLEILARTRNADLLPMTLSCSYWRNRPADRPQCGRCSQCVDRRFGAIGAGLAEYDRAEWYGLDIFRNPLPEGEARTIEVSFVNFAQEIDALDGQDVLEARPELYDCIPTDASAPRVATELVDMVKRHAAGTLRVMADLVACESKNLVSRQVAPDSLVWLALGMPAPPADERTPEDGFRREGDYWALTYGGKTVRVRDRKGIRYIATLLRNQGARCPGARVANGPRAALRDHRPASPRCPAGS